MRRPGIALPDASSASAVRGALAPTATVAVVGAITTEAIAPPGSSESLLHERVAAMSATTHLFCNCMDVIDRAKLHK